MKNKYSKLLLGLLVITLLFTGIIIAHAEGEVGYTFQVGIPGVAKAGEPLIIMGLGTLVNKIITLAYRISMLFVLYKIVEIGFKYMTSKGNADIVASVSKGMKNVLIGVLILFGSYIILRTINPDLTKLPENPNCPAGTAFCDDKTSTNKTEVKVTCPVNAVDNRTAEDLEGGVGMGSSNTTTDNGVTANDITDYINKNSSSFYKSGDWANARKDLLSGNTSNAVWSAVKKLVDNEDKWLDTVNCRADLDFGPVSTGHVKAGDYESCHDSYDAIDLVVKDSQNSSTSQKAKDCMQLALNYLKSYVPEVTACSEIECVPPHVHIQDKNCTVASCRVCP